MEYLQYYDGLSRKELAHDDSWLIVCIEAAWYCESYHRKSVRFNQLRKRCDYALNQKTDGERTEFGGTFASILNSRRCKKFFRVIKIGKHETLIYPNIRLIQEEVKGRRLENFASMDKQLLRYIDKTATVQMTRSIVEPPVQISDRADRIVTRGLDTLLLLLIRSSPCALPDP